MHCDASDDWQVRAVVGDVLRAIGRSAGDPVDDPVRDPSAEPERLDPVESLRAASWLFAAALPELLALVPPDDRAGAGAISLALHEAVLHRVVRAPVTSVAATLQKVQASRHDDRRRISRELHDRSSHSLGLALQQLDMHRYYRDICPDPERAEDMFAAAAESIAEALTTVRQISAEFRRCVGSDGIEPVLRAYLSSSVPAQIQTRLTIRGEVRALPDEVSEELFLILREAARNAVRHGDLTELALTIEVTDLAVDARVVDDGRGFNVHRVTGGGHHGLSTMAERADLLNGALRVSSVAGEGTTVALRIPLAGGHR